MKKTRMLLVVLAIALLSTFFMACNDHKNTERIAKAFISACVEMGKSGKIDKMLMYSH